MISQTSFFDLSGALSTYGANHAGRIQNPGEPRTVGGLQVDVSGQAAYSSVTTAFQPGPNVRTYRPEAPGGLLAGSTLSAAIEAQAGAHLVQLPKDAVSRDGLDRARSAEPAGEPIAFVPETVEIRHTPAAPETVSGPGFIPGEVFAQGRAAEAEWFKGQIAAQGDVARAEAELAKQYGDDIKLAYDPLGQDYLMLRPGQPGYDDVKSAREAFVMTGREAWKLGHGAAFDEVLRQYGVKA